MPAFEKDDLFDKENYCPISLLSHNSKKYEKMLFSKISDYIEPFFRPPDSLSDKSQHTALLNENIFSIIGIKFEYFLWTYQKHVLNNSMILAKLDAFESCLKSTTFI